MEAPGSVASCALNAVSNAQDFSCGVPWVSPRNWGLSQK